MKYLKEHSEFIKESLQDIYSGEDWYLLTTEDEEWVVSRPQSFRNIILIYLFPTDKLEEQLIRDNDRSIKRIKFDEGAADLISKQVNAGENWYDRKIIIVKYPNADFMPGNKYSATEKESFWLHALELGVERPNRGVYSNIKHEFEIVDDIKVKKVGFTSGDIRKSDFTL